jgi:hypothetical protein
MTGFQILLHVRKVPASIYGSGDRLIEVFRGFPQSLQANAWIIPEN